MHYTFTPEARGADQRATAFLHSIKSINVDKMRPEAIESKWTEEILKERGLKAPIGQVKALPARRRRSRLMAAAIPVGSADDAVAALRASTPFRDVPELLARIAAIARPRATAPAADLPRRRPGRRHLRRGLGPRGPRVQARGRRARAAEAHDARRRVRLGGLLLGQTKRLATVTATEPTEVLRIDTEALVACSSPSRWRAVASWSASSDDPASSPCRRCSRRCGGFPGRSPRRCRASA